MSQNLKEDYPPREMLDQLAAEIDSQQRICGAPRVLDIHPVQPYPHHLGPCAELFLDHTFQSAFVLSQKRTHLQMYISVSGIREFKGKGAKMVRCKQPWPRTHGTDRRRPIALHKWICFECHGPPPSPECQATHICGNDACCAASHIRWQEQYANLAERGWHSNHHPLTCHGAKRRYSRLSWLGREGHECTSM